MQNKTLLSVVVGKKLRNEVDNIIAAMKNGFDLNVYSEFEEVPNELIRILEEKQLNNLEYDVCKYTLIKNESELQLITENKSAHTGTARIVVGMFHVKPGAGFVKYALPTPDKLVSHIGITIADILKYYKIDMYLDVFDAFLFAKLKSVAQIMGADAMIDVVVQTAFFAGYLGDYTAACSYLDNFILSKTESASENSIPIASCAKRFLVHAITHGENAHTFLKACLGYYIVNSQTHTMSRASQILGISRTTLLEHLKMSEKFNLSGFFG